MRFITKEEEDRYWRCFWNGNRASWKMKDNFSSEAEMQFVYEDKFIRFCFSEDKIVLVDFPFMKGFNFKNIFIPIARQSLIDMIFTKIFFRRYFMKGMEKFVVTNGL